jgi:hypothetical protein
LAAYEATTQDEHRVHLLSELASIAGEVGNFVHTYTDLKDPTLDTDDEIINWTFGDVSSDLGAAIWNLSCGFYKTSASSLRTALDVAFATLYFQVRQNSEPVEQGWNRFYVEWDQGSRATPSWGESKEFVSRQASVRRFNKLYDCDIVAEAHAHFKYLSAYVHGSAFTSDGVAVRAIDMEGAHVPAFDPKQFDHVLGLARATITLIVTLWQVTYPDLLDPSSHYAIFDVARAEKLFQGHRLGSQAFTYRSERGNNPASTSLGEATG